MKLSIITAHAGADCAQECIVSWGLGAPVWLIDGSNGILSAYQKGFEQHQADILAFIHDDVIIREANWQERVLQEFENSKVGLVGFGGAIGHGDPGLYHLPYDYKQLGRHGYRSNVDDAEVHGERFDGSCEVAVLDGFCLIVRRELLEKAGGWPVGKIDYIAYDYWLSCMAHRLDYVIRLVGVRSVHLGGRTFVSKGIGQKADWHQKYLDSHKYIYDNFRDVLPWRCP